MIERLHFGSGVRYSGLEASIHLARYQLARDLCKGRRVLDIACGEGYGSAWLKQWGALSVDGVDVSAEAVHNANATFRQAGIGFHVYDAENAAELFAGQKFDLIVSLETIEHLETPEKYLQNLKDLLSDDGVIIISCPNDWWYYPKPEESNPYHLRKYVIDEFKELATSVLGEPKQWGIGTAVAGFVNMDLDAELHADHGHDQRLMMQSRPVSNAYVVHTDAGGGVNPATSSYFFGVWGKPSEQVSAAVLPVSMDIFRNGMYGGASANAQSDAAEEELRAYEAHLREARLRIAALTTENVALKANMDKVRVIGFEADMAVDYWKKEWNSLLSKYHTLESRTVAGAMRRVARKVRTTFKKG